MFRRSHPLFTVLVGLSLLLTFGVAADVVEDAIEWCEIADRAEVASVPESDDSHLPSLRQHLDGPTVQLATLGSTLPKLIGIPIGTDSLSATALSHWVHFSPPSPNSNPLRI
jgi:hypothetical protein